MLLENLLSLISSDEYIEIYDKEGLCLEKGILQNIQTKYLGKTVNLIETFEGSIQITINYKEE